LRKKRRNKANYNRQKKELLNNIKERKKEKNKLEKFNCFFKAKKK
jgi:hypothetical protein